MLDNDDAFSLWTDDGFIHRFFFFCLGALCGVTSIQDSLRTGQANAANIVMLLRLSMWRRMAATRSSASLFWTCMLSLVCDTLLLLGV